MVVNIRMLASGDIQTDRQTDVQPVLPYELFRIYIYSYISVYVYECLVIISGVCEESNNKY